MLKKLYCIGDSHVSIFLGKDKLAPVYPEEGQSFFKNIMVFRLGGILAYNLSEYGKKSLGREKLENVLLSIPINSWILISAGEIDCRVHLIKRAEDKNATYKEVANELTKRYISYLSIINQKYNVCVFLPPPSSYLNEKAVDNSYPRYGSEQERNMMTISLRESIIEECRLYNIVVIESGNYIDSNLLTNRECLWDGIHMSTKGLRFIIDDINAKTKLNIKLPISWYILESMRSFKILINRLCYYMKRESKIY